MEPAWLTVLSWLALGTAFACAAWFVVELLRRPQHMWIMNLVWPITALYMGPAAIWAYYAMGREPHKEKPVWQGVFVSATHCGAGCTLGDIAAEFLLFFTAITLIAGDPIYSEFVLDYAFAYVLGIAFQYYNIAPMRGVWGFPSLWAAIKADTFSLTAFEVGLFGWMAITHFLLLPALNPSEPAYWFMMQIGMCLGFITSYPMNWWLIRRGIKEAM